MIAAEPIAPGDLVDVPPAVNPAVAKQSTDEPATDQPTPAEPSTGPQETDAGGTPFDPERHLQTKHPRTGRWMPRRRPKGHNEPNEPAGTAEPTEPKESFSFVAPDEPATEQPTDRPAGPDVCTVMADLHCRAFYGLSVAFISDEWLASKEEHRTNVDTLAAYYRATNFRPDSPGWALLAQGVAFAGKRIPLPKTQTKLGAVRAWFSHKWHAWRGSRRAKSLSSVE